MKIISYFKENLSFVLLSFYFTVSVFNPVFKKYDYGAEFPLLLVLSVIIFILAVKEFKNKRERSFGDKLFLLIFAASVIISFVFSQTKNIGFSEVLAFNLIVPIYFIYAYHKNEWMKKFLGFIVVCAIFSAILGYFLYFLEPETRLFGPFFNILYHANEWPNAFALFLVLTWPIVLLFSKNGKWQASLLIGFLISTLLLTYSRGALIVFCGQSFLLFIYFVKRLNLKTFFLILLSIITCFSLFFGANFVRSFNYKTINVEERVTFQNGEGLTSKQERLDFWKGAITLIKEKPLFGYGPFSFRYAYNSIQKTFLGSADHPHNVFLKIAAENGLIALISFLGFLFIVFLTVLHRFKKVEQEKKDLAFILGVSVLGAFAHNLIDYNLNFSANLFLLVLFIAFIRSIFIQRDYKIRKSYLPLIFSIILALISVYEGVLLTLDNIASDKSYLSYSLYPRNYYLNLTQNFIEDKNFVQAFKSVSKQIQLNPLDSQAWYLRGVIFCDKTNSDYNINTCKKSFKKAIELNPNNEWRYYVDYARVLTPDEIDEFINNIYPSSIPSGCLPHTVSEPCSRTSLVDIYFDYVGNNVHFTAYTPNVEAFSDLIDLIRPYVSSEKSNYLLDKKQKMWKKVEILRTSKTF